MVRLCAVGDPHGNLKRIAKVPGNVDAYLVTGDLGKTDDARMLYFENIERKKVGLQEKKVSLVDALKMEYELILSSIAVLRHLSKKAPIFTIQGNVGDDNLGEIVCQIPGVTMIKNMVHEFKGIKIGFLEYFIDESWVREFKPKNYKKLLHDTKIMSALVAQLLKKWGRVDILVCHQPPYGHLDKVKNSYAPKSWQGLHAGSKVILEYIKAFQPKVVFCGHIHEGKGQAKIGKTDVYNLGYAGYKVIEIHKSAKTLAK